MRSQRGARRWIGGLAAVMALAVGCGDDAQEGPAVTEPGVWDWTPVPESTCDEGTPTGLGGNLASGSKNLVIYFSGGGACWNDTTCLETNSSVHGPFTELSFSVVRSTAFPGSILDRTLAGNPYRDWNLFFLPYCTGDLHAGDADRVYTAGSVTKTFHHRGLANTRAFLSRIAATVPEPGQVLVTGSSAGGFGSALNYTLIRQSFPRAKVFLVDDAGPPFKRDALPPELRAAWAQAWNYDAVLDSIDPAVKEDFSALFPALARKFPEDRMVLLSSLQDETIRVYFQLTPPAFEAALRDLATTVVAPLPRTRTFLTPGADHTLLTRPAAQRSGGVGLLDWLQQMHTASDADWKSVQP
jgi:hypothetical protein